MKLKKSKRGFSLVELMVVVAIMGTLASIAIPAFNEYRRSAKKNAYKADLSSLHKGWLAFGVELDSFCERETDPEEASIANVGMASLVNSKLYGRDGLCEPQGTTCSTADLNAIYGATTDSACSGLTRLTPSCTANWDGNAGANNPGKHNFIGFSAPATGCVSEGVLIPTANVQILGREGTTDTSAPTGTGVCTLDVTQYTMGVYGHVSGADYYGVSINNFSVLGDEVSKSSGQNTADAGCS